MKAKDRLNSIHLSAKIVPRSFLAHLHVRGLFARKVSNNVSTIAASVEGGSAFF